MNDIELKPCPFCGEKVTIWETGFGVVQVVECENCNIRFVFPWTLNTGAALKEKWNRRAERAEEWMNGVSGSATAVEGEEAN